MTTQIAIDVNEIAEFCKRHHIIHLSLFGSVVRADFTAESDVDVLVDFDPGHSPSFFDLYYMEEELTSIFENRKVEMVPRNALYHKIRNRVLREAELVYEKR
ncbi:MAG: nucleotidyltransferase domain-containing protein [Planctomycetes bacterium]|nr:nucleotidyltransferase domain-containing protein [Planctomycetota bacterium]